MSTELVARRYDDGMPVRVELAGGRIVGVQPHQAEEGLPWIAPGLVDLQVNGYRGVEFSSARLTVHDVAQIAATMLSFGVTRFCPTVTTQSFEVLRHAMLTIAGACEGSPELAAQMPGIHLEGPYISAEDGPRGAHPAAHCRPPDWDEFQRLQEAAGGRIRLLTMGVEFPNSPDFIRRAVAAGVIIAIGHTAADRVQIRAAVDSGARLSTHLGNGSHVMLPRHDNYLWPQLAEDRLTATLIVDGHHLPGDVVRTFVRAKTPGRCILVSDLSAFAGLPEGRYCGGGCELEILADGRLVVAGQRQKLAGAGLPLGVGVANVMRFAGLSLAEAIAMASLRPAQLLGIEPGSLVPGARADLLLFDLIDSPEPADGKRFIPRKVFFEP